MIALKLKCSVSKQTCKDLTVPQRFLLAVAGAFVVFCGYGQILRGRPIYSNWMEENTPALFPFFPGGLAAFVAIILWRRFGFLWKTGGKNRRR